MIVVNMTYDNMREGWRPMPSHQHVQYTLALPPSIPPLTCITCRTRCQVNVLNQTINTEKKR